MKKSEHIQEDVVKHGHTRRIVVRGFVVATFLVVALVVPALPGPDGPTSSPQESTGSSPDETAGAWANSSRALATTPLKILYIAEDELPVSLNPLEITTMVERRTLELVHDAPFKMSEDWDLRASLIDRVQGQPVFRSSPDRRSVEGRLKQAVFHDGTSISVRDLRATLLAHQAASKAKGTRFYGDLFASIESVEPDRQRQFKITFTRPLAVPKEALSVKLLPRAAFTDPSRPSTFLHDAKYRLAPIGAGPFKKANDGRTNLSLVLDAHKGYHLGAPKLDQIRIVSLPGATEKIQALKMNQIHVIVSLRKEEQQAARAANAWTLPYFLRNWWYIGFNCEKALLGNPEVRRALGLVVDRFELAEQLAEREDIYQAGSRSTAAPLPTGEFAGSTSQNPSVVLISGPYVPESPYYNFRTPYRDPDRVTAREMLSKIKGLRYDERSESWFYDGHPWTLQLALKRDLPGGQDVATVLRQQLSDFGIPVRVHMLSQAEWNMKVAVGPHKKNRFDIVLARWHFDGNDDITPIFRTGGRFNIYRYSNPTLDKMLDSANSVMDNDLRISRLREVHQLLAEEMPCLFLWEANQVAAFSKDVRGYSIHSFSFYINPHKWNLVR